MRRLLRDIAEGKALGDTTTLADPNVVARLKGRVRGARRLGRLGSGRRRSQTAGTAALNRDPMGSVADLTADWT